MKHYSIADWVDYARGIVPETAAQDLRDHLSGGCRECGELAEFSRTLSGLCRRMSSTPAPEWVVRRAKAIFPVRGPVASPYATWIPAALIYDSLVCPEPAGLQASWQVGWQALYRAGDCSLDLRVEPEISSSRAAVIGQILNYVAPESRMDNVPVLLKSGRSVVAETRSNRFGEFQMEYEQQGRLHLCVYLEDGTKRFQVPLKKLASEKSLGGSLPDVVSGNAKPKADQE